jgi:phage terminase small subunit
MYADCFMDYQEAAANIAKNGTVVAHPRTGSPIENPYCKVMALAMSQLQKLVRLKNVGALWSANQ